MKDAQLPLITFWCQILPPYAKVFFLHYFFCLRRYFQVITLATDIDLKYKGLVCSFTCAEIQIGHQLLSLGRPLPALQYTCVGEFQFTPCQEQGQCFRSWQARAWLQVRTVS